MKTADTDVELPEEHPGWDPTVDVTVSRKLTIDGAQLQRDCQLSEDSRIRLVAGWYCENARSKRFPWRHDVRVRSTFDGTIELKIPAGELATSVELIAGAILLAPGRDQPQIAARIPGSWLWKDVTELRLEPTRGRFPMEWTDFKRSGLPAEAAWYLDWPAQDWNAPLLGALRLRLNATNPFLRKVLGLPESDPKRRVLIRAAMLDVAKQLMITALNSEDFVDESASYPEGSVGFCVRLLMRMAFPSETIPTIRDSLRDQPGEFHVRLQAGVAPFEDFSEE